jgi:putative transposase
LLDSVPLDRGGEWHGTARVSASTWRRHHRIDRGLQPGLSSADKAELAAAKRRIDQLETEPRATRPVRSGCFERWCPQRRFEAVRVLASEPLPVQMACRVLGVSTSGSHAWRWWALSARAVGHAGPADLIVELHPRSRATAGARRVPAELRWAAGSWSATARWSCCCAPGRAGRRQRPAHRAPRQADQVAADLVDRQPARTRGAQPGVADRPHRAPHPRGQGRRRGRAGWVRPPGGRLPGSMPRRPRRW